MRPITAYSDVELERMLADIESDCVERKESLGGDAPGRIREAVCAFANDRPDHRNAGVVFGGAKDDGTPTAITITDELLRQLADVKTDGQTVPPPTLTVVKRTLRGAEMAVATVEPADSPPVRYRGSIYIRIGPRRGIATAQDERILNEKRRYRDLRSTHSRSLRLASATSTAQASRTSTYHPPSRRTFWRRTIGAMRSDWLRRK